MLHYAKNKINRGVPLPVVIWKYRWNNKLYFNLQLQTSAFYNKKESTLLWIQIVMQEGFNSSDVGPGNCLIDQWIRTNSKEKYDKGGSNSKVRKNKKFNF